jgi:outer membrane protein assembly factor BamB
LLSGVAIMTVSKPLRLWPGIVLAVLLLIRYMVPLPIMYGVGGALLASIAILLWWLFFSRAPWADRLGAVALMPLALYATSLFVDVSISNGFQGLLLPIFSLPAMALALVAAAVLGRSLPTGARRAVTAAAIVLACGVLATIRTGGITGNAESDFHWRWTPTPEDRLLAQAETDAAAAPALPGGSARDDSSRSRNPPYVREEPPARDDSSGDAAPPAPARAAEWPGFRGPERDSTLRGVRIDTDWSTSPPVELWRRAIGPGWSSFAVDNGILYTQEQRGEEEQVAAYSVKTGEPVWRHGDAVRFYESNGGAGPRGTPTLSHGRVYALGATGILNVLDAATGAVIWSRNAATDTGVPVPGWGISSSPVVFDDVVVTAISGALVAYETATGAERWLLKSRGGSYSSPQLVSIDGVPQILFQSGFGATSVAPESGMVLWEHAWEGFRIIQPAVIPDGSGVIVTDANAAGGLNLRRLAVTHGPNGWTVEEKWTSPGLKPYFNDFVIHKGHAFGFDGSIMSSIDVADGTRKWKGGRYGHGQLMLLPEQDLLLVISEEGELALVGATPGGYVEHARFKAIDGKTWNHPVLVNNVLVVRNGEEMAAFRLSNPKGE